MDSRARTWRGTPLACASRASMATSPHTESSRADFSRIEPRAVALLAERWARRHRVIPLVVNGDTITTRACWTPPSHLAKLLTPLIRRGVRVVEGARLESVCRGNSTEGSNPSLSANPTFQSKSLMFQRISTKNGASDIFGTL